MRIKNGCLLVALLSASLWACDDGDPGGSADAAVVDGSIDLTQCSNAIDDDGDGLVDLDDPGCDSPSDDDEVDVVITQCSDGEDNDDDGLIDLQDPACESTADDDESDDPPPPQCSNGEDDDGDGAIDLEDRGCANAADPDESDEPPLPACNDGEDNDQDGFTDFPADPGCGSEFDDDEVNDNVVTAQCGNGIDDDNDGQVDLADPGCTSAADPREQDPEERAACSDGVDNDDDGIIDFPLEPGCASAGDDDETDGPVPACGNGLDDDADGKTDYPEDPGCAGIGDRDEADPRVTPACADGVDNDRDDLIDYPEDRGCESAADATETGSCGRTYEPAELAGGRTIRGDSRRGAYESEGSCGGRGSPEVVFLYRVEQRLEALEIRTLDANTEVETTLYVRRGCLDQRTEVACNREPLNDGVAANELRIENPSPGDYYIFLDGASGMGGAFELEIEEVALAQCLNGIDDDADGRTDYPADPGCQRATDRDETDPDPLPACADDEDNDGDGLVDYPLDVGCRAASDDDEVDLCGAGVRFFQYPVGEAFILDTTEDGSNALQGLCGGANAIEKIFLYENPFNANLTFSIDHPETAMNHLIYVNERTCQGPNSGCATLVPDPRNPAGQVGTVTIDNAAPGDYFVVIDNSFGLGGEFKLSVEVERLPPGCSDGIDNDEDGFIDADDLGCSDVEDEDETDPEEGEPLPQCWNGEDDDGDGIIDYPFEPGCVGKGDDDEVDPDPVPACANGEDDDEDGLTDFPNDIGCAARGDEDEEDPRVRPRCNNRIDDDNDGLTDYPQDPGCSAAGDPSEADDDIAPACADGEDNDRDGLVDFPFDPGCIAAGHVSEEDPDPAFACSDREDNDEDGLTDFPWDPGCIYAADDSEEDPGFPPQCANGMDDDRNGRIDFPDDPGCRFAGDTRELTEGPVPARCSDGVDNDADGFVDLTDIGCLNARDNDENDPEVAPYCADGEDNDEDGETDWPDDPGCAAQGDECEQFGFGFCNGECIGLLDNPLNCGVCGRVCAAGVECVEGRCGGLREVVLQCGRSGRPVQEFIRGPLVEAEVRLEMGCVPDDVTQAIVVPRGGIAEFNQNAAAIRPWVEQGGVVVTEFSISDDVYNTIFRANVAQGQRGGNCQDNVQPAAQFSPNDPFWADNDFMPVANGQSGCGHAINNFPDVVLLGGWDAQTANLGYANLGAGRVWLVDADWQDNGRTFTDVSRDLMAYMIANGGAGGGLPPCLDNRDNDEDGFIDAEDTGCDGPADEEEGDPPAGDLPECGDEIDNDDDGIIDFPLEPGCESRGDTSEADPDDLPACGNGLDDDGDGEPDYPNDPGCASVGDLEERNPLRVPECGNRRDDDQDGLTDFPADPGCAAAGDFQEEDDLNNPACANGIDDDRDGITDWPFDVGCASARDQDETDPDELPQCRNGIDDDEDGLTDFPADPGCAYNADPREVDPVNRAQCANGVDDDGDGRTDYPEDRGCFFAADNNETDPFQIPPRCVNGVDDDGDGAVDLADPGCVNGEDDDEDDPAEPGLCNNGIDDDEDGLTDWPADPGCQGLGDTGEAQECAEFETIDIPRNGSVMGVTAEDDPDNYRNQCGGREAPDVVYRYVLNQAGPLTISAENDGTDYPVVLSVRRDCDEPLSQLACVGDFSNPDPTIELPNAQPGEYFIVVDGGGPERWVGSQAPALQLPADPRNFVARNDINANGWSDAGNDAFDGYGRVVVTHAGQASPQLDVSLQNAGRDGNAGPYAFTYTSELLGNVWRIRILPAVENDERPVTITMTGNLGSDGSTVSAERQVGFQGRQIRYFHTTDSFAAPRDPPVYHFLIPSDPEQLGSVNYARAGDNPTLTANNITLPATFYIGLSYNLDFNAVANAIVSDLEIQAGGGGPDAPRFGNFELSVQEGEAP